MRGAAGRPPLDPPTIEALGAELGARLAKGLPGAPVVVLGGDTRESTAEICGLLAKGLEAVGAEHRFAGVIPTPGLAFLARDLNAHAAVAVSASHNPYADNGIKLLDERGFKWTEAAEEELERGVRRRRARAGEGMPPTAPVLRLDPALRVRYLRHLAATVQERDRSEPLGGLRVALDAGNGAASSYAGELFADLGADVILEGSSPNGRNINLGVGSTAPETLAAAVPRHGAHFGAAFDGDADRCIIADERGTVRDGDAILYLWATALAAAGQLATRRIVATSMSNLGLERALGRTGIGVVRCGVGDRAVVDTMRREGIELGGEQSGHIVELRLASTGDGMLTALQIASILQRSGKSLSELLAPFERFPQVLLNVRVGRKVDFAELPAVSGLAQSIEGRLGQEGRLVLRYSGTEPLARVMIEGPDQQVIQAMAEELVSAIHGALGAPV
jgi:phosphoglucosamine mutase